MEVDDEGLGLGSGPGPSDGGAGRGAPGWEGAQATGGLPLPPLTRPAPLVEEEEDEERRRVSTRGASAGDAWKPGGQLPAAAAGAGEAAAAGPGGPAADSAGVCDPAGVPLNPESDPGFGYTEMEAAGDRAARVLPVTFALAEAALEALAADTAAAEALADGIAVPGDPQPVLSQGCACCGSSWQVTGSADVHTAVYYLSSLLM